MKTITTLCCAVLAFCSAIYASSSDHLTVRFDTPVTVGEAKLPAGNCDIQVLRGSSDSVVLVFRSEAGPYTTALAFHLSEGSLDAAGNPIVVLNRRGTDLQLSRILLGDRTGYQLNNQ